MIESGKVVPVVAVSDFVMFPDMVLHLDINEKMVISAVNEAIKTNGEILLVAKKSSEKDKLNQDSIYSFGVISSIKQVLKQTKNTMRILVEGKLRAQASEFMDDKKCLKAKVFEIFPHEDQQDKFDEALVRQAKEMFAQYLIGSLAGNVSRKDFENELVFELLKYSDMGKLADYIAVNMSLETKVKQSLLEESNSLARLQKVLVLLSEEIEILKYKNQIAAKIKSKIDDSQKEYFLREQIRIISEELGEDSNPLSEAEEYLEKLKKLDLPEETYEKLFKEYQSFIKTPPSSPDANVQRNYLEFSLSLPWNTSSKETLNISRARKILDSDHFGLDDVKKRIIEFLAVKKLAPDVKGQIICLSGPPGVGKTSIAKSLAKAINRKYARISLGGVGDESEIRGHRKTYLGAMPGRIMSVISQVGTNNPLILLDEIDKLSKDYKGDPASALLEVLDPEQNSRFHDRYLDVAFDLSKVMFIVTANDTSQIPKPLYDRMEIIDLYSYTYNEKFHIAKNHLIPKQLKRHGLTKRNFSIGDETLKKLIECYTKEAGVRELERKIASLMRKVATDIVSGKTKSLLVGDEELCKILGPEKYKKEDLEKGNQVGVVNGLAWTSVGGEILPIEVALMDGKGKLELTGCLGDVMKESAKIALSYIRSNANNFGIKPDFYKNYDIHIHAPEGAVPKDGPSAGVTMTTALVSALTKKSVFSNVAMTGEITLKGKVIPIGGLKEKTMAAYKEGMKTVIIPSGNLSDLEKIDEVVKNSINFVTADTLDTVFKNAIVDYMPNQKPKRRTEKDEEY